MTIESGTYLSDLNINYPETNAMINGGDNHIRWIKSALKNSFPNVGGAITASHTTINTSIASVVAATHSNTANTLVKRDSSGNISAGTITGTGFATTGNMSFGDNDKAIFGAGSDLQIYHTGSNSYFDDAGSGSLHIRANNLYLQKYTGENYLAAIADGPVSLYYNNSQKLATTNTGIDITGKMTSDTLTVGANALLVDVYNRVGINGTPNHQLQVNSGSDDCIAQFESSDSTAYLSIRDGGTTHSKHGIGAVGNDLTLYANDAERVRVTSDGKLGINTVSPQADIHISAGITGDASLIIESDTDNAGSESDNPRIELRQDANKFQGKIFLEGNSADTVTSSAPNALVIEATGGNSIQFATGGTSVDHDYGFSTGTARATIDGNGKLSATLHQTIFNQIYPIGAIYISTTSTSPATLFGGSWSSISGGRVLQTVYGSSPSAGAYYSSNSRSISISNMPSHNHTTTQTSGRSFSSSNSGSLPNFQGSGTDSRNGSQAYPSSYTGSGTNFNVQQASYGVYMWRRTGLA